MTDSYLSLENTARRFTFILIGTCFVRLTDLGCNKAATMSEFGAFLSFMHCKLLRGVKDVSNTLVAAALLHRGCEKNSCTQVIFPTRKHCLETNTQKVTSPS
jgi:hypothetical protein